MMVGEASITILLALLAGAITLVGPLVTRSNLVSGFRQNWINDQRNDLATIAAKAAVLSSNTSTDWARDIEAFATAASRIRLRQNPDKAEEWSRVLDEINTLYQTLWNSRGTWCDVTKKVKQIESLSQKPLKDNWNKTRSGEKQHIVALGVAAAVIIVAVLALAWSAATGRADKQGAKKDAGNVVVITNHPSPTSTLEQPAAVEPPKSTQAGPNRTSVKQPTD